MIKQFNFYDIYGYLLPGIVLLGLIWVPIGVISKRWPDQDISKTLFLAALAYFLGHVLQSIATTAVPSKVMRDEEKRLRFPSERLLDASHTDLSPDFKAKLAQQVQAKFSLDLHVAEDGEGFGIIYSDRNTAFVQARSYLIAKKTAQYVEQFEGLYAMMRGFACALLVGGCYLAGWAMAFQRNSALIRAAISVLGILGLAVAIVSSIVALARDAILMRRAVVTLAFALLIVSGGAGFWVGAWQPTAFWGSAPPRAELVLWLITCFALIAAARCFSSYRSFAIQFAQSVWRDFSVHLTVQEATADGEDDRDED